MVKLTSSSLINLKTDLFNKEKLELLNESISLTSSLNQQNQEIKTRKAEIQLSESKIHQLLKQSNNLEIALKKKIEKLAEETKKMREEFLKIDGIQEIQIHRKNKRKGSMESPTKGWSSTKIKIKKVDGVKKGDGEWNLEISKKNDEKNFKRAPQRSSTFVEEGRRESYLDFFDKKEEKDEWDFGEEESEKYEENVKSNVMGAKSDKRRDEKNSLSDKKFKKTNDKYPKKIYTIKTEYDEEEDEIFELEKKIYKNSNQKPKGRLNCKSQLFPNKDNMIKSSDEEDNENYLKIIPAKLDSTRMTKNDLLKLYKKLMPKAKKLIRKLKKQKKEVLEVNTKIGEFIGRMDNNLNQKYRCKRCFKKFILSENQTVYFFSINKILG